MLVNKRWGAAVSAAFSLFCVVLTPIGVEAAVDRDEIVLTEGDITITLGELAEYVSDRILPEAYERAVAKPGAVAQSVGNLYIIRRAADLAREEALIGPYRSAFVARDAADREAVELYVEWQTAERLESADWEALAREQFLKDAEIYASEERVRVSHILVSSEDRSFSELVTRVAEVEARLQAGEPFDVVALEYSDDSSAERNRGSLGSIRRGQMVPPFEAVAFSMSEEGAVSEPFLTDFGVHIVRFEGRETGEPTPFAQVKDRIIQQLQKKRSKLTRELILEPYRGEVQDQLYQLDEPKLAEGILDLILERTP